MIRQSSAASIPWWTVLPALKVAAGTLPEGVAATVQELYEADTRVSRFALAGRAMNVGRSHIAATVNTLVLAYAGAAMPILLVFAIQGLPGRYVVSTELVAMEVVRGLVGSLGIIMAVPLTTALAAMAVADRSRDLVTAEPEQIHAG